MIVDHERSVRHKIIDLLNGWFNCMEEVRLRHLVYNQIVVADVVAFPMDPRFPEPWAFEVKVPTERWEFKDWTATIKQASDYVDAEIVDARVPYSEAPLQISASFIFPAPPLTVQEFRPQAPVCRDYDVDPLRGAFFLATHFRVGYGKFLKAENSDFALKMGPSRVWSKRLGFSKNAEQLILGRRRLGSRKVERPL